MNAKRIFTPPMIAAAALLVVALVGLQTVVYGLGLYLFKQRLEPRQQLYMIPAEFGPYKKIGEETLAHEMIDELGTEQYINWTYENTSVARGEAGSDIRLHVAYHTGAPDSVPHVTERCFIAGEAKTVGVTDHTVTLASPNIYNNPQKGTMATREAGPDVRMPGVEVPVRRVEFKPRGVTENLGAVYFYIVNGKVVADPAQVRTELLDSRVRYGYWCKVEVQPRGDTGEAVEAARKFLSLALPEILGCLPDWQEVLDGKYPRAGGR